MDHQINHVKDGRHRRRGDQAPQAAPQQPGALAAPVHLGAKLPVHVVGDALGHRDDGRGEQELHHIPPGQGGQSEDHQIKGRPVGQQEGGGEKAPVAELPPDDGVVQHLGAPAQEGVYL